MTSRVGRQRGAKNAFGSIAKENLIAVFMRLGGMEAMAQWAEANQTDFYRIYARLVPQQIDMDVSVRECDVSAEPLPADEWDKIYSPGRTH